MRRTVLLLLVCFLALLAGACGDGSTTVPRRGRVLLVGIDGASMRVAGPMLEQGRLPTLAAIARAGVSGTLRSVPPLVSPPIWATIATGKARRKHGILNFTLPENGGKRLYQSSDRKVPALWNIVSAAGLSVGVVNWWNTFPVEKVAGIMVSDHAIPGEVESRRNFYKAEVGGDGPVVFPEDWQLTLARVVGSSDGHTADDAGTVPAADIARVDTTETGTAPLHVAPPLDIPVPYDADALPRWMNRRGLDLDFERDKTVARIALTVEAERHPDVLMVFLPGIDRASHILWGCLEPAELYPPRLRPSPSERVAGVAGLEGYYAFTDRLIGMLASTFGPDDLIMVVSDHGFEAGQGMLTITGIHESAKAIDGVVFARGPDIAADGRVEGMTVNDVTPTILAWLGLPVAEDMDGAPAAFLRTKTTHVVSYDATTPVERVDRGASGAEERIYEELRALGYIK